MVPKMKHLLHKLNMGRNSDVNGRLRDHQRLDPTHIRSIRETKPMAYESKAPAKLISFIWSFQSLLSLADL